MLSAAPVDKVGHVAACGSIDHRPSHHSHEAVVEDTLVAGDPVARPHSRENRDRNSMTLGILHPIRSFFLEE